jgi:hypothetical protein
VKVRGGELTAYIGFDQCGHCPFICSQTSFYFTSKRSECVRDFLMESLLRMLGKWRLSIDCSRGPPDDGGIQEEENGLSFDLWTIASNGTSWVGSLFGGRRGMVFLVFFAW